MKNIGWIMLLVFATFSCLENIDDVELTNHPFDPDYELPMGTIENIITKDTVYGPNLNFSKCIAQFQFTPHEETLRRVKASENIFAKNVRFIISSGSREIFSLDLEKVKPNKTYFVSTWDTLFNCGDNLCLKLLYADQDDGQPWEDSTNILESKIQKEDCFTISP